MQLIFPGFTRADSLLSEIRNSYWLLRALRPGEGARRRALYRRIAKIKAVLIADGFDGEELRLFCRSLASLDRVAVERYERYRQEKSGLLQKTLSA